LRRARAAGVRPRPGAAAGATLPSPTWLVERVLYRDGLVLVVDKPAGVPVHAGPGGGVNLEHYFEALRFGLPRPPALAHRLDRDTSGCLVLGRHRKALARLGRLFAGGQVEKVYWAIVRGRPPEAAGRVELALRKRSEARGWWMQADPEGQAAVTDYRVLGEAEGVTWVECRPRTGRTHQVRVHCAELGCPVLGDPIYGGAARGGNAPLHLHARAVGLPLYPNRPPLEVVAPPPPHMLEALRRCGYGGDEEPASPAAQEEADGRHWPGNTRPSGG
jgi:tRNA pseudouridine32 synthase / 23S rRNA pseudouridine746 synthase